MDFPPFTLTWIFYFPEHLKLRGGLTTVITVSKNKRREENYCDGIQYT